MVQHLTGQLILYSLWFSTSSCRFSTEQSIDNQAVKSVRQKTQEMTLQTAINQRLGGGHAERYGYAQLYSGNHYEITCNLTWIQRCNFISSQSVINRTVNFLKLLQKLFWFDCLCSVYSVLLSKLSWLTRDSRSIDIVKGDCGRWPWYIHVPQICPHAGKTKWRLLQVKR